MPMHLNSLFEVHESLSLFAPIEAADHDEQIDAQRPIGGHWESFVPAGSALGLGQAAGRELLHLLTLMKQSESTLHAAPATDASGFSPGCLGRQLSTAHGALVALAQGCVAEGRCSALDRVAAASGIAVLEEQRRMGVTGENDVLTVQGRTCWD